MGSPYRSIDDFLAAFATTMDLLPTPWGFKDAVSQHLYMNTAIRLYTATPKNYSLEGKKITNFPRAGATVLMNSASTMRKPKLWKAA